MTSHEHTFALVTSDGPDYGYVVGLGSDLDALWSEIRDHHTAKCGYQAAWPMHIGREIETIYAGPVEVGDRVRVLAA